MKSYDLSHYPEIYEPMRHLATFGVLPSEDVHKLFNAINDVIKLLETYEAELDALKDVTKEL